MSRIHHDKLIPVEYTIKSIDDILYRIGLSLSSNQEYHGRKIFYHPMVVLIYTMIFLLFYEIPVIFIEDHTILKVFGIPGHFFGMKVHWISCIVSASSLVIGSQLVYRYNFNRGINPSFLRVFQMMSGLVTPQSVGLYREEDVRYLLKRCKIISGMGNQIGPRGG